MVRIASNLQAVRQRIFAVQQQSDAPAKDLRLIAVSKTFPAAAIIEAMKAGQMHFGENYVQEAVEKMVEVARVSFQPTPLSNTSNRSVSDTAKAVSESQTSGVTSPAEPGPLLGEGVELGSSGSSRSPARFVSDTALAVSECQTSGVTSPAQPGPLFSPPVWHFIGPIQSNKTRAIAEHFDWVHSVDRLKIAQRLSEQRPHDLKPLKVLIQVNISREASKSGVEPQAVEELARGIMALPRLEFCGLMAIPEPADTLEQQRLPFAALRQLADQLEAKGLPCPELSMGMSADLEAAIMEGATMIRVGSAIFGARTTSQP